MRNKIIVIGWVGDKRVYLNVPREEAIRRYKEAEGDDFPFRDEMVEEIDVEDEFRAYDVWGPRP